MTIAELCMLATVILALVSIVPAKFDGKREFDNGNPRDPRFYTPGLRSRALGAHQNALEALPFFLAAVLLAEMRSVPQGTVNALAVVFLVARMLYLLMYLADRPSARSAVWIAGFICNIVLFCSPWWR